MDDALYRIFYETEETHWWFAARREILVSAVERYGNLSPGDTILDVGCGTGANAKALSEKYRVVAMDASPLAVKYAKMRGLRDVLQGNLEDFPRGQFDVRAVTLLDVIEHIDDDVAVLKQAREIVGDSGRVIITVPAYMWMWSSHDVLNHHKRRYDAGMLRRALDAAGLEPIKLSYFNTFLFPLAAARRLLDRGKGNAAAADAIDAPPEPINALFRRIFAAEKHLVPNVDLPFGVSLLAVARAKAA